MKYPLEKYTDSGFYSGGTETENYKEKVVKCRKPHKCSPCRTEIKVGENALRETGFLDGEPVSSYTCLPCIDKWLEESGQVEHDLEATE